MLSQNHAVRVASVYAHVLTTTSFWRVCSVIPCQKLTNSVSNLEVQTFHSKEHASCQLAEQDCPGVQEAQQARHCHNIHACASVQYQCQWSSSVSHKCPTGRAGSFRAAESAASPSLWQQTCMCSTSATVLSHRLCHTGALLAEQDRPGLQKARQARDRSNQHAGVHDHQPNPHQS